MLLCVSGRGIGGVVVVAVHLPLCRSSSQPVRKTDNAKRNKIQTRTTVKDFRATKTHVTEQEKKMADRNQRGLPDDAEVPVSLLFSLTKRRFARYAQTAAYYALPSLFLYCSIRATGVSIPDFIRSATTVPLSS